VIAQKEVER
jgi:hypothetical protein